GRGAGGVVQLDAEQAAVLDRVVHLQADPRQRDVEHPRGPALPVPRPDQLVAGGDVAGEALPLALVGRGLALGAERRQVLLRQLAGEGAAQGPLAPLLFGAVDDAGQDVAAPVIAGAGQLDGEQFARPEGAPGEEVDAAERDVPYPG